MGYHLSTQTTQYPKSISLENKGNNMGSGTLMGTRPVYPKPKITGSKEDC
jgi:hypothetical protein